MERVFVITFSAAVGTGFFIYFSRAIKKKPLQDFVHAHLWLLHPNAICYWRAAIALGAFLLYFFIGYQSLAIFIFTIAAICDGIDGVVARQCDLQSRWGEWLDPMCDKLTYLPPLLGFAYVGIISTKLVWILIVIEAVGQFFARHILKFFNTSGAANNFGKIKAIICFTLVILCALLHSNPHFINICNSVLLACIVLAAASIIFKFVSNRLYADILSTLNFFCGVTSLVMAHNYKFAWAICIIIIGQLFDLFDGRMAQKHGGTKYGPLLDDFADFVSFGIAPAYVIYLLGGSRAGLVCLIYVCGVAFRLIRFVAVDKKRTDLPEGIFNGLPSPAGALIVLGFALVIKEWPLLSTALVSTGFMVSRIRFAHFGRVIVKTIPKPVFFTASAALIVMLAFVLKTKNAELFGYMIILAVSLYMIVGNRCVHLSNTGKTGNKLESER